MDTTFFHDLPGHLWQMFKWASHQDGTVAFALGSFAWFLAERIFGFVTNPIGKIMSLIGFVFVIVFGLAFMTDFATSYDRGTVPFTKTVPQPNVTTLRDPS